MKNLYHKIMAFQEMVESDMKELTEEVKKHRKTDLCSGNSLIIKTESGLTDNIEQFLPSVQLELPFSFATTEIFDIFTVSASKKSYHIIEKNSSMATAVYKEKYSFKNILLCCLPAEQRQKNIISAIRLHININESSCKRTVNIKGIYGYPQTILPLISDFQSRIEAALTNSFMKNAYSNIGNDEDETIVTCKHESSSYYQFYKILSSENYTLGNSISLFVSSFAEQYRNPTESVSILSLALDSIKDTIEQAVEALFTHYNYGRANSEKMMIFCRPAVEKYIYTKVYNILFPIYTMKMLTIDDEIKKKKNQAESISFLDICKIIEIKEDFIVDDYFSEACILFEGVEELKSPLEKLNCFMNVISSIRASVIDFSKGKVDVSSVEDEVKILVFIVLKTMVAAPAAEVELVKDYSALKIESESKSVLNLSNALYYVTNGLILC